MRWAVHAMRCRTCATLLCCCVGRRDDNLLHLISQLVHPALQITHVLSKHGSGAMDIGALGPRCWIEASPFFAHACIRVGVVYRGKSPARAKNASLPEPTPSAPAPDCRSPAATAHAPRTQDYKAEYGRSYFAVTRKKAGWDCLRHVEVIALGAVPYVPDLQFLPPKTMVFYPRALLEEARNFPGTSFTGDFLQRESFTLDPEKFSQAAYFNLAARWLEHGRQWLTSKAMARYMLQTMGLTGVRSALVFTICLSEYLAVMTMHGFKQVPLPPPARPRGLKGGVRGPARHQTWASSPPPPPGLQRHGMNATTQTQCVVQSDQAIVPRTQQPRPLAQAKGGKGAVRWTTPVAHELTEKAMKAV